MRGVPPFKPAGAASRVARVRVLLVGSGGREHALAWKLAQSPLLDRAARGARQPRHRRARRCHPVRAEDAEGLLALARALGVDLVVVGPEAPLVAGVADELRHAGVAVFGPSAAAARIEGSKRFAKDVHARRPASRRPDAGGRRGRRASSRRTGSRPARASSSAATQDELDAALRAAAALGDEVVIEELLEGEELSVFALCDGATRARAAARAGLQARRRRRPGPEHRRHGRVLAGPGARRRRASTSSSTPSTARCSTSSPRAARRSSGSSSPA